MRLGKFEVGSQKLEGTGRLSRRLLLPAGWVFVAAITVAGAASQRGACESFGGTGRIPYCGAKPGVYAIIDNVTFEPAQGPAERVRLEGVFTVPIPVSSGEHKPPERGFLYLSLVPENETLIRQDWKDLAAAAGTGRVVGFGEYWVSRPMGLRGTTNTSLVVTVHKIGETARPEPYPLPHEHGVLREFERPEDFNPRFGEPSSVIIAALRAAAEGHD